MRVNRRGPRTLRQKASLAFLELREHKLAAVACFILVGLLSGLTYATSDVSDRQTQIERTVKVQRIQVHQLLCESPDTRSCQRRAINVIEACLSTAKCRGLLVLASTTPPSAPLAIVKGGGAQPPGHQGQQHGGGGPPTKEPPESHGGASTPSPSPAPTQPGPPFGKGQGNGPSFTPPGLLNCVGHPKPIRCIVGTL